MNLKKLCENKYNGVYKGDFCKVNNKICPLKNNDFVIKDDIKKIVCKKKYNGTFENNTCTIPSYDNSNEIAGKFTSWDKKNKDFNILDNDSENVASNICKYYHKGMFDFGINSCAIKEKNYYNFSNEFNTSKMDFDMPKEKLKHVFVKTKK